MIRHRATSRLFITGPGCLAAAVCAFGTTRLAMAGDDDIAGGQTLPDSAPAELAAEALAILSPPFAAAVLPDESLAVSPADGAAPAQELAAGLDVAIQHNQRKFRSSAVSWMTQRSAAMGRMTDLLLSGSDSGWHLVVDPRGADEYILEWKIRFR